MEFNTTRFNGLQSIPAPSYEATLPMSFNVMRLNIIRHSVSSYIGILINEDVRHVGLLVNIYFDGPNSAPYEVPLEDIDYFSEDEELSSTAMVIGSITSNTCELRVYNANDQYNPDNSNSPFYSKLVPNVKIEVFAYCIDNSTLTQYNVKVGTYYTSNWTLDTSGTIATVECNDAFLFIKEKEIASSRIFSNITAYDAYVKIFEASGISLYEIDSALEDITILYFYVKHDTFGNNLKRLAQASMSFCYMSRDDKVIVQSYLTHKLVTKYLTDLNQIIDIYLNNSYKDLYSVFHFDVYDTIVQSGEVLRIQDLPISGTTYGPYNIPPTLLITSIEVPDVGSEVNIQVSHSATQAWLTINTELTEIPFIIIKGNILNSNIIPKEYIDTTTQNIIGDQTFTITNDLIQNTSNLDTYNEALVELLTRPNNIIEAETRGDPTIALNDSVSIVDETNEIHQVACKVLRTVFTFETGFSQKLVMLRGSGVVDV